MGKSDQGVRRDRYLTVPRTLIFLTHQDRVLLIKGDPQKRLWANLYNGIGGHVEQGEAILTSARRELLEETGYQIDCLDLVGVVTVDTGENVGINFYIFRGDCPNPGVPTQTPEGTPEWVPISRLGDIPLVEDLPVILPRILETKKGQQPFFAQYSYDREDRLQIVFAS